MRSNNVLHLSDSALDHSLNVSIRQERSWSVTALVRLAEFDRRKLYLSKGYSTMQAYCVSVQGFSDDEALKKLHVARKAREFPILFTAMKKGRLHLTGARMLAPHLTAENVEELVQAASRRTCAEIEQMLNRRIVRLETLMEGQSEEAQTEAEAGARVDQSVAVEPQADGQPQRSFPEPALMIPAHAARHEALAGEAISQTKSHHRLALGSTPLGARVPAPEPCVWVALEKRVHEKLQYARALLSHRLPLGSASLVLERALDDLIAKEEKRKYALTKRPRTSPRPIRQAQRTIPAHVRRAVKERDGGRCTFVGSEGHRCQSSEFVEFDHIVPVARGGQSTLENIRLRCRAHNQYEAERAFGAEFMQRKRENTSAAAASGAEREGGQPTRGIGDSAAPGGDQTKR